MWLPPVWSTQWPVARAGDFLVTLTLLSLVTSGIGLASRGLSHLADALRARSGDAGAPMRMMPGQRPCSASTATDLLIQTLALAGAMAGLSGLLIVAQYGGLGFAGGFQFGLKALIAAIIGGIGSVPGALVGGLFVGLFETLWSAYLPIEARDMALYATLIVFLILRPGGLLGLRDPTPRSV